MRVRRDDDVAVEAMPRADRAPAPTRFAASPSDPRSLSSIAGLQGAVGNRAVAQLLGAHPASVQRHSEAEAARGIEADDEGTVVAVQRDAADAVAIQRDVRPVADVKGVFDAKYAQSKDLAVNYLKSKYGLDSKPYALSVEDLGDPHTHALTGGGWNSADTRFREITVRVNEPYLDRQATTQDGFNKLIHTLGHEYQHVKQRSQKGWRTTDDDSAKGEREFLAYSWELIEAAEKKRMAPLAKTELLATLGRALEMYAKMDAALQQKHDRRYQQLLTLKLQNENTFFRA
jgi:hypothetical protein